MKIKNSYLMLGLCVLITLVIGCYLYMKNSNENNVEKDREVEKNIAVKFSEKYLDPKGNEIHAVTFYKEPVTQNDATGNRNYFFILMINPTGK